MKKAKTGRDRLIGGLGGSGGALALSALLDYLFYPSWRESTQIITLSLGIIGTCLVLVAVFIHLKNRA